MAKLLQRFMKLKIVGLALVVTLGGLATRTVAAANQDPGAFSEWSAPVNLGAPLNTAAEESAPALSDDQLSFYFNRNRNVVGDNHEDLYVSRRSHRRAAWSDPVPLTPINTPAFHERNANVSVDGLVLFFSSDRPGGFGGLDLYVSRRMNRFDDQGWSPPMNLGAAVNSAAADVGPAYVENEAGSTVLYFTSNRPAPAGFGAADIYRSVLAADGSFGPAVLVPELSSPFGDARPAIRTDGLELVLHSNRPGPPPSCPSVSPAPSGGQDLWVSTRASVVDPWSCPVNAGSVLNSTSNDLQAALSDDAETLLFSSNRPGGMGSDDLWMSRREPAKTSRSTHNRRRRGRTDACAPDAGQNRVRASSMTRATTPAVAWSASAPWGEAAPTLRQHRLNGAPLQPERRP